ncbi:transcriptional regulator NadR [Leptospira kobayashii]|uniref:Transcriptional regulator NadR n=1 Tax=Leptospira kobayashii TaxID=1917830 RepID=A0ABN6KFQ9_9LEPT|nr:transcriptional regulator NadR [Leptospira kobayashii]
MIQEARKECNHLTILVATLNREIIPGKLRWEWMKELTKNLDAQVIWVQDENPQEPHEHPDFWNIWKQTILKHSPAKIDIIFTSEHYGDPLAEILNTKHRLIDIERKTFPISASKIRNAPSLYWDFIPEIERPYFLKRIVITGSESVGKTTLSEKLAEQFQTNWVPEYAREYLEEKKRFVIREDIPYIAFGHLKSEIEFAKNANRILFLDTDLLTTKIYSEHYFDFCPEWLKDSAYQLQYDDSLFLDIDVPWEEDPLRDLGHIRSEMKNKFINEMKSAKRKFHMIRGSFVDREKNAMEKIESILKEPMNPIYFDPKQISLRNVLSIDLKQV